MKKLTLFSIFIFSTACTSYGPMAVTSNSLASNKMGSACKSWVLARALSWGRNDVMKAAMSANIEKISVVDTFAHHYVLWGKECTHVYGI